MKVTNYILRLSPALKPLFSKCFAIASYGYPYRELVVKDYRVRLT